MELSSPPKPTRIVDCLMPDVVEERTPQTQQTSSDEDFAEPVGEVSQIEAVSLPALAGEVAEAQKQQINELSKRLEVLDQLKVSFSHGFGQYPA